MNTEQETQNNRYNRKIGDIVSENYHAAAVFREYGIDFCCGGGKNLQDVCRNKGIFFEEISARLKTVGGENRSISEDYNSWEPDFLADYIVHTHHRFVKQKTGEINAYAAKVAKVHGASHPENIEILKKFVLLSNEMAEHMKDEETRVFPLIREIYKKRQNDINPENEELRELRAELNQMEKEHEAAGSLMADIHELSDGFTPPSHACATWRILYQNLAGFEEDLHKHVHLENNILFKKMEHLAAI